MHFLHAVPANNALSKVFLSLSYSKNVVDFGATRAAFHPSLKNKKIKKKKKKYTVFFGKKSFSYTSGNGTF